MIKVGDSVIVKTDRNVSFSWLNYPSTVSHINKAFNGSILVRLVQDNRAIWCYLGEVHPYLEENKEVNLLEGF